MLSPNIEIIEATGVSITQGPLYRVIIHNDNVTSMDFVLVTLVNIFFLAGPHALQVMYTAHFHGKAYVQTLPLPEANKRVGMAHMSARLNGYPLQFTIEPEVSKGN